MTIIKNEEIETTSIFDDLKDDIINTTKEILNPIKEIKNLSLNEILNRIID